MTAPGAEYVSRSGGGRVSEIWTQLSDATAT